MLKTYTAIRPKIIPGGRFLLEGTYEVAINPEFVAGINEYPDDKRYTLITLSSGQQHIISLSFHALLRDLK